MDIYTHVSKSHLKFEERLWRRESTRSQIAFLNLLTLGGRQRYHPGNSIQPPIISARVSIHPTHFHVGSYHLGSGPFFHILAKSSPLTYNLNKRKHALLVSLTCELYQYIPRVEESLSLFSVSFFFWKRKIGAIRGLTSKSIHE